MTRDLMLIVTLLSLAQVRASQSCSSPHGITRCTHSLMLLSNLQTFVNATRWKPISRFLCIR